MFSQLKLIIAGISSVAVGIFIYMFKARGTQVKQQEAQIEDLERSVKVELYKDEVTDKVAIDYQIKLEEIDKDYEEGIEKAYSDPTVDLSPSLLSKLRSVQGLQDNPDKPPE